MECPSCGQDFRPRRSTAKFCGDACRKAANRSARSPARRRATAILSVPPHGDSPRVTKPAPATDVTLTAPISPTPVRPIPDGALILTLGEEIKRRGIWDVWHGGRVLCRSHTPLLDGARVLLAEGASPQATIVLMRDGVESLRARLGYAATLRVKECADGVPRFATYVPYPTTDEDAHANRLTPQRGDGAPQTADGESK